MLANGQSDATLNFPFNSSHDEFYFWCANLKNANEINHHRQFTKKSLNKEDFKATCVIKLTQKKSTQES